MAYNESQNKATQKYIAANLDQVRFYVQKGEKDALKAIAKASGKSMAQYIIDAVNAHAGQQILTPSQKEK